MESTVSTRLKDAATLIGYSENQLIVESLIGTLDLADDNRNAVPRVVVLIRSARSHQTDPVQLGQVSSSQYGIKRWWGR